MLSEVQ
ncbi:unnamed protein product [Leptidea sinapis]|nr:unnamed protein product [Leptidea sinapis]